MKHFLPANRILWVNTIGMRNPRPTVYDIKRSLSKLYSWVISTKLHGKDIRPHNKLYILNPVMAPYNNIGTIRFLNRHSVISSVRRAINVLAFHDIVLLATVPNAADYIGFFSELVDIYYCVDDFIEWPEVNRELVASMEEQLLVKAHFVCASSEDLCNKKMRLGKRPVFLPHGVDFDHFAQSPENHIDPFPGISKPIIGFFGSISSWLDIGLLAEIARLHQEWSFVFIGSTDTQISPLSRFANVHFLGKVLYEDLPCYAAFFDVGLIPFRVNNLTTAVNPIKLMEYLACGLPVVSTPLPEVLKYSDIVHIASTPDTFADAIAHALSSNSADQRLKRQALARSHSWHSVAESLSTHIEPLCKYARENVQP
jgi:glycosyltransferase involved in cell wall biosynthesis